ncbi:MAG: hypothetical protein JNM62_14105 [Flavobacteriales bacterium]|nr:hypothetical protein [Flavobacteriales bacterium]
MIGDHLFVLLRLRWLQVRRAFPVYGRFLLAFAVLAATWALRNALIHDATYAPWVAASAVLLVMGLHQRRRDHRFLQRHLPKAHVAMAVEYLVLVLPFVCALLLAAVRFWALLPLLVVAVPWSPVAHSTGVRAVWLRDHIPTRLFEWRSSLQATHPWTLLVWLLALAFCWLPVLPLFLLGGIALVAMGAQEQCEPRAMLLATANEARALLRTKVYGAVRLMLLVQLPVLIGATLSRPDWWWIHGLFGIGMLVLVAYAVVLKYANYRPNERLEANGANVGVAAVFAILPGLGLVPLIMFLTELPKARANLHAYFHDHHH